MSCVKSQKTIDTSDAQNVVNKNGRTMERVNCVVCGITKTQFVKGTQKCASILNEATNSLPFEMHFPAYSFTGPCNKLSNRLKPNLTPKDWINL